MKRTGDGFGQEGSPADGKRSRMREEAQVAHHKLQKAFESKGSAVDQRALSVAAGQQLRFEEGPPSLLQDHPFTDLFSPSRGHEFQLQRPSFDAVSQGPMSAHTLAGLNDLIQMHRLESTAALLRSQEGFSGRLEQGGLGFDPVDLLRLARLSNVNVNASLTNPYSSPIRDPRSMGGVDFSDPRLSAAHAGRTLPELYRQHQMLALANTVFESRAASSNAAALAPASNYAFMPASNSSESSYGALGRIPAPAPFPATDSSQASSYDDPKSDDRLLPISLPSDEDNLSEYQCLVRKQICLFEAKADDVDSNAQGRNRPIVQGQVGIQCRYCISLSPGRRTRGAVYFPAKLPGLYQAAQNMAINHFTESCQRIPEEKRAKIRLLKEQKASIAGGGKQYWANGARVLGVRETDNGLIFDKR